MKGKNFNMPGYKPCVLVAPLDWGLGHATRSVPVINGLIKHGCEVIIAAEGAGRILLEKEFPGLRFLQLRGYRIHYSNRRFWMPVTLFIQLPKIILSIYHEHLWLKKAVKEHSIDAVISDNRMGLYHSSVPCVYITHQLKIKTGGRFTEWLARKIHYRFIDKYNECWVPDAAGEINLAGELSHPVHLPKVPVKYLGPLSRFEKTDAGIKYDLLIILSGPEPQRTVFEKIIIKDLENYSGRVLLVRGLLENADTLKPLSLSVEIQDHLSASEMRQAILESEIIISRSGYSTVMDMVKLQKKAILVPTPGQTEQEYLADYLLNQEIFFCVAQEKFSLAEALKRGEVFSFRKIVFLQNDHEKVISDFILRSCRSSGRLSKIKI
jgi:uncharacterized protein (TIGR00661 family)